MALNSTDSEKVKQAAKDLADKLKLERRMIIELRSFFKTVSTDLALTYAQTGVPPSADDYVEDLFGIINRQYSRTAKKFSKQISSFLRNKKNTKTQVVKDLTRIAQVRGVTLSTVIESLETQVALEIARFVEASSIRDTALITATNQKEIDKAVIRADTELREDLERTPTRSEVSSKASKGFKQRSFNRVGAIAATTTQGAAEGTKQIERDNFYTIANSVEAREAGIKPRDPTEIWVTQGDNLVRDGDGSKFNHLAADFQEKKEGVFRVSGEFLRYPGDRSLGASAGNTINCRCSAVTVIE